MQQQQQKKTYFVSEGAGSRDYPKGTFSSKNLNLKTENTADFDLQAKTVTSCFLFHGPQLQLYKLAPATYFVHVTWGARETG